MSLTQEVKDQLNQRSSYYWTKYGLNQENMEDMLSACDSSCEICHVRFEAVGLNKRNVDHCYKTEKVRGLLCTRCNHALGLFRDNPYTMLAAIRYLLKSIDLEVYNEERRLTKVH